MRPGPTDEIIQRIEAIEGRPVGEALGALYLDQKLTMRMLCERWTVNHRTLMRLMKWYGVAPRKGADAVKLQWEGNVRRRQQAADILRKTALAQSAAGKHNRLGKTKETDAGVASCAEKLRETTSAHRADVRAKMSASRKLMHRKDPSTHLNAKATPTECEQAMLDALRQWGFAAAHNHSVFPYWVDIFIRDLAVGIECFGAYRQGHMRWDRHAELRARGLSMLYVANRVIKSGNLGDLHQHLSDLQMLGANPATQGQEAVIWGCRSLSLFTDYPDNITVKRTYLNGLYRLDIAAPADNEILTR